MSLKELQHNWFSLMKCCAAWWKTSIICTDLVKRDKLDHFASAKQDLNPNTPVSHPACWPGSRSETGDLRWRCTSGWSRWTRARRRTKSCFRCRHLPAGIRSPRCRVSFLKGDKDLVGRNSPFNFAGLRWAVVVAQLAEWLLPTSAVRIPTSEKNYLSIV